jgi:hypothetical protein
MVGLLYCMHYVLFKQLDYRALQMAAKFPHVSPHAQPIKILFKYPLPPLLARHPF